MARVGDNHPLKGAHGSIGRQMVARTKGDNTFLSMSPKFDKDMPASEAQQDMRDKLAEATGWGQWVLANPVYKQVYERERKPSQRVFNCAVSDCMGAPEITGMHISDHLAIDATDNFRVVSVNVEVLGADGSVLEAGSALLDTIDLLTWRYHPVLADWQHIAASVQVSACDLPGNLTTRLFLL